MFTNLKGGGGVGKPTGGLRGNAKAKEGGGFPLVNVDILTSAYVVYMIY